MTDRLPTQVRFILNEIKDAVFALVDDPANRELAAAWLSIIDQTMSATIAERDNALEELAEFQERYRNLRRQIDPLTEDDFDDPYADGDPRDEVRDDIESELCFFLPVVEASELAAALINPHWLKDDPAALASLKKLVESLEEK
jgi:hypothetical protein